MRWLLLILLLMLAVWEGLVMSNLPVFGPKLPLTWLALYLIMANSWVGWRQSLILAATAGYLLDVLAAPAEGGVLIPLIGAWLVSGWLLNRYNYSRNAKIGALLMGSGIYLIGSYSIEPFWPGWSLTWQLFGYLALAATAYWLLHRTVFGWLRRI